MDILKLKNKVALITGGTTGMGAATALLFQKEGAKVIATGSNPDTLKAARESMPGIDVIASDAGDPGASANLIGTIKAKYGKIDVLFVNAGIAKFALIDAVDEAFFDAQFNVNVRGAYFTIKHAIPIIADGGSIILTGSIAATSGAPGRSVYGATKAALRAFGRDLAVELAPRKIRVNTLSPGAIETPIFGKTGLTPEAARNIAEATPLGRIGQTEEIATAALFLATDALSYVTGSDLAVDGGMAQV